MAPGGTPPGAGFFGGSHAVPSPVDRRPGASVQAHLDMLILLACSMGSVFIPYYFGRESLKLDLEDSFLELSNAIRVSIDQLTAPAASEEDRLRGYVESLKKTGIREVSIVGEDMGIIDSPTPGRSARCPGSSF